MQWQLNSPFSSFILTWVALSSPWYLWFRGQNEIWLLLAFFHGLSLLFTFEGKGVPNSLIFQVRKRSGFLLVLYEATYWSSPSGWKSTKLKVGGAGWKAVQYHFLFSSVKSMLSVAMQCLEVVDFYILFRVYSCFLQKRQYDRSLLSLSL